MQKKEIFVCLKCGTCCRWPGHVLLTSNDINTLSEALSISEAQFIEEHTVLAANRSQLSLAENADGSCRFLTPDNKCKIYEARPKQCRDFPYEWRVKGCPSLDSISKHATKHLSLNK